VAPIIAFDLLALIASVSTGCEEARAQYRALELEEALATASAVLVSDASRPLACLEVKALVHLILNQDEDAKAALVEIFERSPDHEVDDPSLSPGTRETISAIRESVRPLEAKVSASWIIHESLRMDVLLEGGLRDAARVRFRAEALPAGEVRQGEVMLLGRAATATVGIPGEAPADRLRVEGQVLDRMGRVLHPFSADLLLPARPASSSQVVEVERGGVPWPVWVAIVAAAVIGAGVTIGVVAQPGKPDADGTAGRFPVDP
jgi:hypothetical protein